MINHQDTKTQRGYFPLSFIRGKFLMINHQDTKTQRHKGAIFPCLLFVGSFWWL